MSATALWTGESDGLVARDPVLARLREAVSEGSRTALVLGLPGAGKSAALSRVGRAATADGWSVLRVRGHEPDRGLPFAALVDLLGALGVTDPLSRIDVGNPLRMRLQVLALLEAHAQERSVLLLVDDAQWVDESSLAVLAFVANRLTESGVSFVAAVRGDRPPPHLAGHPEVHLEPLTDDEAATLLRRAGFDLDALARESVVRQAAGNPLALLALGRSAASGAPVPPSSAEAAFADEVAQLPEPTRRLLRLAAAGDRNLGLLGRVVGADALVVDLAPAETARLLAVVDRRVEFQHPLVRAAVWSSATTEERLRAHADLAAAHDDPDKAVWHRAEASVVPDETVATELEQVAKRTGSRGAAFEAAQLMRRAVELTPNRGDRDERTLHLLAMGFPAGRFEWLAATATELRQTSDDPSVRARASHYLAYALAQTRRQSAAKMALVEALEELVAADLDLGWGSLTTLASLTYATGGDTALVASWLNRYERETPPPGPPAVMAGAARDWVRTQIDPLARPADVLARLHDARELDLSYPPEMRASYDMLRGAAAWLLDETDCATEHLRRAVVLQQRERVRAQLPQTLTALAQVRFDAGAYDEVDDLGRQLLDLAEAEHLTYTAKIGRELRARVAGIRGDSETALRLGQEVLLDLDVGECLALECDARVASAWALFAQQDHAGAHEQLRGLFRPDGEPVHPHIAYRHLGDAVAAAVRVGELTHAERVVAVAERHLTDGGPRRTLQLARARALLARDDAEPFHVAATTGPRARQWPFELASAQLEYGIWLRRRQRTTVARAQLQAAYDVFDRLGTRPWADLSRAELRAAGVVVEPGVSAWDDLTAQERHVVRLAASGMTNREIGASLYLSPRTVSAHLYNAFPKLGVTARSQLRDIVGARELS